MITPKASIKYVEGPREDFRILDVEPCYIALNFAGIVSSKQNLAFPDLLAAAKVELRNDQAPDRAIDDAFLHKAVEECVRRAWDPADQPRVRAVEGQADCSQ